MKKLIKQALYRPCLPQDAKSRSRKHQFMLLIVAKWRLTCQYSVYDYESAEEALEMTSKLGGIDPVITDILLLGMKGPELESILRIDYPELPVMFVSGFAGQALDYINKLEDTAHFLSKPFTRNLLLQKVAQLM